MKKILPNKKIVIAISVFALVVAVTLIAMFMVFSPEKSQQTIEKPQITSTPQQPARTPELTVADGTAEAKKSLNNKVAESKKAAKPADKSKVASTNK